jgi:hypothetical protein
MSKVPMCEVRSKTNNKEQTKKKKGTVISREQKWTLMNPI